MAWEVVMGWIVLLVLVVGVPIGLLLWTRRNSNGGEDGTDPQAHRLGDAQRGPYSNPNGPDYGGSGNL
jgi:hypothetical protein